jgi:hypothetical protein
MICERNLENSEGRCAAVESRGLRQRAHRDDPSFQSCGGILGIETSLSRLRGAPTLDARSACRREAAGVGAGSGRLEQDFALGGFEGADVAAAAGGLQTLARIADREGGCAARCG